MLQCIKSSVFVTYYSSNHELLILSMWRGEQASLHIRYLVISYCFILIVYCAVCGFFVTYVGYALLLCYFLVVSINILTNSRNPSVFCIRSEFKIYFVNIPKISSYPIPINLLTWCKLIFESQLPNFDVMLTFISFNKI